MKFTWKRFLLLTFIIILIVLGFVLNSKLPIATGYAAKNMCSCVFVADRPPDEIQRQDLNFSFVRFTRSKIDRSQKIVTSSLAGLFKMQAAYREGYGCSLVFPESNDQFSLEETLECVYEDQNDQLAKDSIAIPESESRNWLIDTALLNETIKNAFDEDNAALAKKTRAVVILHQGKLIAEKYAKGFDVNTPQLGWSMTKSLTNAIAGLLVNDGIISIDDRAPIAAWEKDARRDITMRNLLQQNPGLEWEEFYGGASDVTEMLYRQPSKSEYAIQKPLIHPIGEKWIYSSGTSNIISHILMSQFTNLNEYVCYVRKNLFEPLGMDFATMEPDAYGEIIGSSYAYATPRGWAQFGQLYLQDGVWNGRRLLPKGWVKFTREAAKGSEGEYGAHFWLNDSGFYPSAPRDMFSANGFQGQRVFILPSHNLVIVRLGISNDFDFDGLLKGILASFQ